MRPLRFPRVLLCVLPVLALHYGAASAQDLPNSGFVAGTSEELSSMELADGRIARRMFFSVSVVADDAENPFGNASQDCFATYVFETDGSPVGGRGVCDGINADGDIWWISLELRPDGLIHWEHIGGTGRLANVRSSGTTTTLAEFEDGKIVGRFEGTRSR